MAPERFESYHLDNKGTSNEVGESKTPSAAERRPSAVLTSAPVNQAVGSFGKESFTGEVRVVAVCPAVVKDGDQRRDSSFRNRKSWYRR